MNRGGGKPQSMSMASPMSQQPLTPQQHQQHQHHQQMMSGQYGHVNSPAASGPYGQGGGMHQGPQGQMMPMQSGHQGMGMGGGQQHGMSHHPMHQHGQPQPYPHVPGIPGPPPGHPNPQHQHQQAMAVSNQPPTIFCRFGSEYVQEIVTRTLEIFQLLRTMAHTSMIGSNPQIAEERRKKLEEFFRVVHAYFKRLRIFYDRCNEYCNTVEYQAPSGLGPILESLIPLKDSDEESDEDEPCTLSQNGTSHQEDPTTAELPTTDQDQDVDIKPSLTDRVCSASSTFHGPKIDPERKRQNPKLAAMEQEYQDLLELNQLKSRQMKEIIDRLRKMVWDINTMLAMRKA